MNKENDSPVSTIAKYVARYFGGSVEQGMGIVEDHLRYVRWERQLRLFDKATETLKSRGLDAPTKTIPQKFMIPLLEAATLEEDDELQNKWALLLANAADKSYELEVKRNYITILENITEFEAKMFDDIVNTEMFRGLSSSDASMNLSRYPLIIGNDKSKAKQDTIPLSLEIESALNNLLRLGLLYNETFGANPVWVRPSALGKEFYRACANVT